MAMHPRKPIMKNIPVLLTVLLALTISAPARAGSDCQADFNTLKPLWDKMSGTTSMEKTGRQGIAAAYRNASILCQQGRQDEAERYLITVRDYLAARHGA
jgi:hypothetical protein